MSLSVKITVSLVIATLAATLVSVMMTGAMFDLPILAGFALACVCSVLVGAAGAAAAAPADAGATPAGQSPAPPGDSDQEREYGKVKWFNGNKGFGFIIRDNGEEIFVHFRSIQGGGRRGLRDGQRVSFVVRDSDKGPQAEEVAVES